MTAPADLPAAEKGTSLWSDAWRRLRRNRLAIAGAAMLVLIVLLCTVGPVVLRSQWGKSSQKNYLEQTLEAPTWEEPMGRDALGRSYVIRVLEGGRTSLMVGLVATVVSLLVGVVYGSIAGYYGGRLDEILMRIVDFLYGIPYMFLVILIVVMFEDTERGKALPVFMALGLVQWLTMARIVRGNVIALRNQEFVHAARLVGASDARVIFRHILPNVLGIVIIYATLTVPAVIILESFLSYLGLGLELSWGLLVSEAVGVVNPIKAYWWLLLWPSLFLGLTLFSLNFLGDGLRDALDPKTRR